MMGALVFRRREGGNGGGRGIRTPEGLSPADLQSESFGQLGYPTNQSKVWIQGIIDPGVKPIEKKMPGFCRPVFTRNQNLSDPGNLAPNCPLNPVKQLLSKE